MLIKADLHIHTSEDKEDSFIKYSSKDIIAEASKRGFGVIAITRHRQVISDAEFTELKQYAKTKNILLIRGVEAKIEEKHVLIYNITPEEHSKLETFEDLRKLRRKNNNIFVIAPHPFMPKMALTKNSLNDKYLENKDLFDALEFQQFYSFFMNPNKKTEKIGKQDGKTLVANSDSHFKRYFGIVYTLVDINGKLTEKTFFDAIKKGKTKVCSKMNIFYFFGMLFSFLIHAFSKEHFRS